MRSVDEPWRWLESTRRLQLEAYGHDMAKLRYEPEALLRSLRDNLLAALVELAGEVPREFHWKPWSHDGPWVHRDDLVEEIIDVQHFLGNMLVALGVDDDEYARRYQAKQEKNRARQAAGYKVERKTDE